ncbi:MAG: hypothetical protein GVY34_05815 [Alphaproteobacteria bacterium]|jgi:hypothetical protein|nr:hypothetical protein [Alphaproteobacteria bacterium]
MSIALIALPTAAIAESIDFRCDFGFLGYDGSTSLVVETEASEIEIDLRSGGSFKAPILNSVDDVVIAFWVTSDMRQIITLSLNTRLGDIALARVGTKEPLMKEGNCERRN